VNASTATTVDEDVEAAFEVSALQFPEPEDWGLAVASPLAAVQYVEDLLKPGRILLIAAVEGVGKSYADLELGVRLAVAGGAFAETWAVQQRSKVWMLCEMPRDDSIGYRDRVLHALDLEPSALVGRFFYRDLMTAANGAPALLDDGWRTWATDWCAHHEVTTMFVDTATTGTGGQESWGEKMVRLYADLRVMQDKLPTLAIVLNVHLNKPNGRGQRTIASVLGDWAKWADIVLLLEEAGEGRTKLSLRKRVSRPRTIVARQRDGLLVEPMEVGGANERAAKERQLIAKLTEAPNQTRAELATALGWSEDTVKRYAKRMPDVDEWQDGEGRYAPVRLFLRNGHEG
jgi:RecA-family ATPase